MRHAIVLWGALTPKATAFYEALRNADVAIKYVINTSPGASAAGVTCLAPDSVVAANLPKHIPIVLLDGLEFGHKQPFAVLDPFAAALSELRGRWRKPNPILHPVAFSGVINIRLNQHLWCGGFPGSGNVFVQGIIERFVNHRPYSLGQTEQLLCDAAISHYRAVMQHLEERLNPLGRRFTLPYPNHFGTIGVRYDFFDPAQSSDEQSLDIFDLPERSFLWSRIHATHERPDRGLLARLSKYSMDAFVVVRDPLDTIVSCASKYAYEGIDPRTPAPLLWNFEWFSTFVNAIGQYLVEVVSNRDSIRLIRYEDLYSDFEGQVAQIGRWLGFRKTPPEVKAEIEGIRGQALAARGHFWKPGTGKWREYLSSRHLEIFCESEAFPAAKALGYPCQLETNDNYLKLADNQYATDANRLGVEELRYCIVASKRRVLPVGSENLYEDPDMKIRVIATDPKLIAQARITLGERYFRELYQSSLCGSVSEAG